MGGSELKADDLFDFELDNQKMSKEDYYSNYGYDILTMSKSEIDEADEAYDDMQGYDVKLKITPKIKGKDPKKVAEILSNLTELFDIGEYER